MLIIFTGFVMFVALASLAAIIAALGRIKPEPRCDIMVRPSSWPALYRQLRKPSRN